MEQPENNLVAVIDSLFAGTTTRFTTESGLAVEFKRAGIVQLGKATGFFNKLMDSAPQEKVHEFIELVAGAQRQLLADGKSVNDMDLATDVMLTKALNNRSLLLTLFAGMAEEIPAFVAIFSSITAEQFTDLSLDEQMVCAAGVFIVNYGFFTHSLPPIIKSVTTGWKSKRAATQPKDGKQEPKNLAEK